MTKWYEVKCTQYKTYMIEVEDDEDVDQAYDDAQHDGGPWDEMTACEVGADELDAKKRHADEVMEVE